MHIATYNVRTLLSDDNVLELKKELEEIRWNIVELSEVRKRDEKQIVLKSSQLFHHKSQDTASENDVRFIIHK